MRTKEMNSKSEQLSNYSDADGDVAYATDIAIAATNAARVANAAFVAAYAAFTAASASAKAANDAFIAFAETSSNFTDAVAISTTKKLKN